jgi:hypothetical protein
MKSMHKWLERFWAQEKGLTILLLILVAHIFIVIPFGQKTVFKQIIFFVFYVSLLSAGMFFLTSKKNLRVVLICCFTLLVLLGSGILFRSAPYEILNDIIVVVYCILLGWVVLLRTFSKGPVTIHRILGAIVVYLLIGLVFALLYHSIFLIEGDIVFKGLSSFDRKEFMYFSLTTLTTAGYGDITPAIASVRSLANLESLIGQLYPAILIARLVSMEFETSKER